MPFFPKNSKPLPFSAMRIPLFLPYIYNVRETPKKYGDFSPKNGPSTPKRSAKNTPLLKKFLAYPIDFIHKLYSTKAIFYILLGAIFGFHF